MIVSLRDTATPLPDVASILHDVNRILHDFSNLVVNDDELMNWWTLARVVP
jgi:hypothetical protein